MKEVMFKISPELNDGDSFGVCRTVQELLDSVKAWAEMIKEEELSGESCEVSTIEMTKEEYDSIPEC